MNVRLTVTAAVAVFLASLALSSVIASAGWIATGFGAIVVVALAGIVTRLSRRPSAAITTFLVLIVVVPLMTRPGYGGRIGAAALIVATALSATGLRPLRAFATLAGYASALLIYFTLGYAHMQAYGHVIPSQASFVQLGSLWQQAFSEFRYAPPIPDLSAVSMVTAAGIGVVAICVDILAARLRRPAVAGLPLLVLFSVPIASNLKTFGLPQMVIFAVALAGYLALLSADGRERLRMWGRLVTFRHVQSPDEASSGPDTRELAASGRRIGLAAICLAIVVPVVLPSVAAHDLFGTHAGTGGGDGGTAGISPLLRVASLLEGKPQPVFSYTTTAASPPEQYFGVYALNYSARQNKWLLIGQNGDRPLKRSRLPLAPTGVTTKTPLTTVTTRVRVSAKDTGEAVLPLPYAPSRLTVGGSGWVEAPGSLEILSTQVPMPGLQYTVVSREADPKAAGIPDLAVPAGIEAQYGSYRGPDASQLRTIALQHTASAVTPLQQALALQKWFLSGAFAYTLHPDLPSGDWLKAFLTTDRRGFCSQFAQAFAVLARELGIPSRIAIGYTGGTAGSGRTWNVTTADAHAWPELYFAGEGWLRFEPTPHGSRGQDTAVPPSYAGGSSGGAAPLPTSPITSPGPSGAGAAGRRHVGTNRFQHQADDNGAPVAAAASGSDLGWAIGIPAAIFLLLAWPALIRLGTRRRRWSRAAGDADLAHAAWRELTDNLADYGLPAAPGETPRAAARRLTSEAAGLSQAARDAVVRMSRAEEHARYAPVALPGDGLRADSITVRRALAASVSRRDRMRARLLPASTLLAARRLAQRAGEVLSWLDSSWPALRRQLRSLAER